MKKLMTLCLAAVIVMTVFAGCGNPLFDDFENFLNVEMEEVNTNYEKIQDEADAWDNFEDDAAFVESIEGTMLPLVYDSLEKLENIKPETDEVKAVKDKYVAVMQAYREGFETLLSAFQTSDEELLYAGEAKIDEGLTLLDDYNNALEALAEKVDAKIEY